METHRGYVVVLQDLRGRYQSEGFGQYFHTANVNEGRDGYDTIEWIARQPWSNAKIGMVGSSHVAMVQTAAALYRPPHLTAIWPDVGPINIYAHEDQVETPDVVGARPPYPRLADRSDVLVFQTPSLVTARVGITRYYCDVKPNSGEPMGRHTRTQVAHNRVYLDRAHPSHIRLPIIPR